MGCTNSKSVDTPTSSKAKETMGRMDAMLTEFNPHNPQQQQPQQQQQQQNHHHHLPAAMLPSPARPPIVPPQQILRRGVGNSHDALVMYSINARNQYTVDDVYDNPGDQNFLGRGAFGTIYLVTPRFGARESLALKYARPVEVLQRIPLRDYDDLTYRVGEIKSLLMLRNCAHILQIREFFYDFHNIANSPLALVTELMTGEDLDKWMKARAGQAGGVTELTASYIARSLLEAVRTMHSRGIVHRDLKVSNMRITNPDDPRSVKVYDFGLAKVLDHEHPYAAEDCGSLGYTAPELLRRERYGVEVDMFSTGVIIFFILSGYRPFNIPGADRGTVKQRIIDCEYTLHADRWSRVSLQAQNLVRGLLTQRDGDSPRLNVEEAVQHDWLREDEATIYNHGQVDLGENATQIEVGPEWEPVLSHHSISTIPAVQVDPNVKIILTQIDQQQIGANQYAFVASETNILGVPLLDYVIKSQEPYTERRCRLLFSKIFKAFETLHLRNIVHRSIRREHIFVQESGGGPRIVIAGMHNARVMVDGNPITGNCGTSLVATAPEVYRAIAYDSAVDTWALGVLLYEFMVGLFPFRGRGPKLREEIARAAVVFDDFYPGSNESRALILKLIQANPVDRPTLTEALAVDWFRSRTIGHDLELTKVFLAETK